MPGGNQSSRPSIIPSEIIRWNDCQTEHTFIGPYAIPFDRREAGEGFPRWPIFGDGSLREAMNGSDAFWGAPSNPETLFNGANRPASLDQVQHQLCRG
jgi:hypothetical protein